MRHSGSSSTRSRYQTPARRPGLRTAFMSPPSVMGFSGLPGNTPNAAGEVSATVVSWAGERGFPLSGGGNLAHRHSRFWTDGRKARHALRARRTLRGVLLWPHRAEAEDARAGCLMVSSGVRIAR